MTEATAKPIATAKSERSFGGLRVVAFESRLAAETATLVEKAGGIAIVGPSMRELPLDSDRAALDFARGLVAGEFDVVVFLTGVGAKRLFAAAETEHARTDLVAALARTTTVVRGPKPARFLREIGARIDVEAPEPNTWRELLAAMDADARTATLDGRTVAVQEYGVANDELLDALGERGARVVRVPVYRWGLPEDTEPLRRAVAEVLGRTADVVLFTSANQVFNVVDFCEREGVRDEFLAALDEVLVGSVGPICSDALARFDIAVAFAPNSPKLGPLVGEAARRAPAAIAELRTRLRAEGRLTVARSRPVAADGEDGVFLRACRREPVPHTPVWIMRQAGRYMQEYREVRAATSFIDLCKKPDLAAQVTVEAQRRIGADAAVLFSDILLLIEPLGVGLSYARGEGPRIDRALRSPADIEAVREVDPRESLPFVAESVAAVRAELDRDVALLGFSGAPFTLASYLIEGGGSRHYLETKRFMYRYPDAWKRLLDVLARAVGAHLRMQIDAGADAVQLFDSWVGCLSPSDYRRYVLEPTRAALSAVPAGVPVVHFGTGTAGLLDAMAEAGGTVLGVDHSQSLASVRRRFPDHGVQGNLDPAVLLGPGERIAGEVARVLDEAGDHPGHVFNLGHGILPGTPVANVERLVDAVHEQSAKRRASLTA